MLDPPFSTLDPLFVLTGMVCCCNKEDQGRDVARRDRRLIAGGNTHDDALIAHQDFIRADGKLRRRCKAQLPVNNGGLQLNRLLRSFTLNVSQHLKKGLRLDPLFALPNEFGEGLIETFLAHLSILLFLPPLHPVFPQIESNDDESPAFENDLDRLREKTSGGLE
jgi:hypothetical protein